jgi:hypothetical protein
MKQYYLDNAVYKNRLDLLNRSVDGDGCLVVNCHPHTSVGTPGKIHLALCNESEAVKVILVNCMCGKPGVALAIDELPNFARCHDRSHGYRLRLCSDAVFAVECGLCSRELATLRLREKSA